MSNKDDEGSPNLLTVLIFFFVCMLIAGFMAAVTNDVIYKLLKDYQGLLAGFGAITAALIAYKAAMAKVVQDAIHKERDEKRHFFARNLHAIRVARYNLQHLKTLLIGLHFSDDLNLEVAKYCFKYVPIGPSGGLVECLNNATELEPRILVQLHRLYYSLEDCSRVIASLSDEQGDFILRNKDGWVNKSGKILDDKLRFACDLCRVIITLGREVVGSEYRLGDEEFDAAKNKEELEDDFPEELPEIELAKKL